MLLGSSRINNKQINESCFFFFYYLNPNLANPAVHPQTSLKKKKLQTIRKFLTKTKHRNQTHFFLERFNCLIIK